MLARSGSLDEHYELAAFQQQEQIANYAMQLHEIERKFSGVERDAVVKMEWLQQTHSSASCLHLDQRICCYINLIAPKNL